MEDSPSCFGLPCVQPRPQLVWKTFSLLDIEVLQVYQELDFHQIPAVNN